MFRNDIGTGDQRHLPLPYVTRLACADTPEVEEQPAAYIRQCMCNCHYFRGPFENGLEVLAGALAIGRQADPLGPDDVRVRLDAARVRPRGAGIDGGVELNMREARPAAEWIGPEQGRQEEG